MVLSVSVVNPHGHGPDWEPGLPATAKWHERGSTYCNVSVIHIAIPHIASLGRVQISKDGFHWMCVTFTPLQSQIVENETIIIGDHLELPNSPSLLQQIFPTQGSNLYLFHLLHCRLILYWWATGETQPTWNVHRIFTLSYRWGRQSSNTKPIL